MTIFFTLGYEGMPLEALLALLQANGVAAVIDVRKLPLSRKPGFSKRGLAAALATEGIGYSHLPGLGTPKPLRDAVKKDHDYEAFFAAMRQHLQGQQGDLAAAHALVLAQPSALLCVEAAHTHCHRLTVAELLIERSNGALEVRHLGV